MHSFELKTVIAAPPSRVFAAVTDPKYVTQWDYCRWMQNDLRLSGKIRKRDEEMRLFIGEIVGIDAPYHFAVLTEGLIDPEDDDQGRFPLRLEYEIEPHEDRSALTFKAQGFPSEELCQRERNSWGGYFLEKLKKVAEAGKNDER